MIEVDCIVVNWNSGEILTDCLKSLENFNGTCSLNVVVIDNASVDESEQVSSFFSDVRLVCAGENLGFGKACNLGATLTGSNYILFLNPDAELLPDSLEKALDFMQEPKNATVGICGVQLLDESGHVSRSCARFPTPIGFIAHSIGLDRFLPKLGHFMAEWSHDSTQVVDHVIGAFYLVRRELFEAIGGFDEQFFVYLEDLDFSYRAHKAGWQSVYLADVQAFHAGGGTSNQVKAKRLFYSLRSRLLYAFKHFHLFGAVLVFMTTLFIEPISRSALAIGRRSWSSLAETWEGYGVLWRWLPQWIFKGVTR
ncbi:glycosyltransferase family 2 protein [Limnohabitans sp. 63ED37-2]|uniref:glycosyltransferase family 2 protein n=1 Tax=Limnohabitans sp. 63ED37-2 TaxID=1678128 RepID=UPI000705DC5D|nr:glycosyltransferase family 2 protein [Limnohabitans sp. 63ED37-2]ALK87352.1 N-acetylglucosaminyl-diphospho-decaprenol L-rhamnosyltransferase [Limnohabitans sp. 63ED37-2]